MAEHQWLMLATYEFSEVELEAMLAEESPANLTFQKLVAVEGPGCFKCEQTWHQGKGKPCPVADDDPQHARLKPDKLHVRSSGRVEEIDRE